MTDISNLGNTPIKFNVGGKSFDVKRLSVMDLFATFESDVKKSYLDDVIALASRMDIAKERIDFQKAALKEMPRGKELSEQVSDLMNTFEGGIKILYMALSKCNKISVDEVKQLVGTSTNPAEITAVMDYVVGGDIVVNSDKKEDKSVKETFSDKPEEKKT
jgi:hypothetical protein